MKANYFIRIFDYDKCDFIVPVEIVEKISCPGYGDDEGKDCDIHVSLAGWGQIKVLHFENPEDRDEVYENIMTQLGIEF